MILMAPDLSHSVGPRLAGLFYAVESALSFLCTQETLRKIEVPIYVSLNDLISLPVKPVSSPEGLGFTPEMDEVLHENSGGSGSEGIQTTFPSPWLAI
jgi:hypothetical protein